MPRTRMHQAPLHSSPLTTAPLTPTLPPQFDPLGDGTDLVPGGGTFTHFYHPTPRRLSPRAGPIAGGTSLTIAAANLANGSALHACHFGGAGVAAGSGAGPPVGVSAATTSNATLLQPRPGRHRDAQTRLVCVSPPAAVDAVGIDDVEFSLAAPAQRRNVSLSLVRGGQTLTTHAADAAPYTYYNDSGFAAVHPASGPSDGGTSLTFVVPAGSGAALVGAGESHRCRFDVGTDLDPASVRAAGTASPMLVVNATLGTHSSGGSGSNSGGGGGVASSDSDGEDSEGGGVVAMRCVSPPMQLTRRQLLDGEGGGVPLGLSLNGQQVTPLLLLPVGPSPKHHASHTSAPSSIAHLSQYRPSSRPPSPLRLVFVRRSLRCSRRPSTSTRLPSPPSRAPHAAPSPAARASPSSAPTWRAARRTAAASAPLRTPRRRRATRMWTWTRRTRRRRRGCATRHTPRSTLPHCRGARDRVLPCQPSHHLSSPHTSSSPSSIIRAWCAASRRRWCRST